MDFVESSSCETATDRPCNGHKQPNADVAIHVDKALENLHQFTTSTESACVSSSLAASIKEVRSSLPQMESSASRIRASRVENLEPILPLLRAHAKKLEQIFARLDQLDTIMQVVRSTLDCATARVEEAERDCSIGGITIGLEKIPLMRPLQQLLQLGGISTPRIPFANLPPWQPLQIYDSNEYFVSQREIPASDEES